MAAIKALDRIANKWATVTPQRSGDYEDGIRNPSKDWARQAAAAESSYKDGVTKAANAGRFGRGVSKAGTQAWQQGALDKGTTRWGPGVSVSQNKYAAGIQPYHSAISSATLPPRYARRDPRNLDRVKAVVMAVSKVKEGQVG
jgi:hypothetical protein